MTRRLLPALLLLAAAVLAAADGPPGDALEEVFRSVDARAETIRDLRAEFRQTKKMRIRKRPDVVTGRLSVKKTEGGPRICWESWLLNEETGEKLNPQRTLVLGDEKLLWNYLVEENAAERTDLGAGKFEIGEMLTVGGSLSGLKKSFEAALVSKAEGERGWVLAFTPTSERLKKFVKTMELEIHPSEWLVNRIRWTDTAENVTEILLSKVEVNAGVDEKLFEIPKDAKVTVVDFGR